MPFEKLLCPIDFSQPSDRALEVATRLAARSGAPMSLVHVVRPVWWASEAAISYGDFLGKIHRAAETDVERRKARVAAAGVPVETQIVDGTPWDAIVHLAAKYGAGLIVVGAHGRTGIKRVLLGSVAERVIRHAPCPVLVTRGEPPEDGVFRSIACAVDFSDGSRTAMRAAADLARRNGAALTLVHVHQPAEAFVDETGVHVQVDEARQALGRWQEEARELVGDAVVGATWVEGCPGVEVDRVAAEAGHDLIVVGTMGRTGLRRVLVGSVAEKIVRHAPCSVLVMRRREGAQAEREDLS